MPENENDKKSLINVNLDTSGLSKPGKLLIEKVSNAVGAVYRPVGVVREAKAEAEAKLIAAHAGLELSAIEQRGLERLVHQEARKQENIESITAGAVHQLPHHAETQKLDEDWLAHFFDKCEKVSDAEMQSLWSRLLAGEATGPGTYSKRTVNLVASMDKKDAELFTQFCQFIWVVGEPCPMIFDTSDEIYTQAGVTFSALKHLDSMGLISFDTTLGFKRVGFGKGVAIFYFGTPVVVEFPKEKDNELEVGKVLFTKTGTELANICAANRNEAFYEYAMKKLSEQKLTLSTPLPVNQR